MPLLYYIDIICKNIKCQRYDIFFGNYLVAKKGIYGYKNCCLMNFDYL